MKFQKRPAVIRNILLFCILSLFYLLVIESLEGGVSALDLNAFISFLRGNWTLLGFLAATFLSVYFCIAVSPYIFLLFCIFVLFQSIGFSASGLNKLVLVLNFLYSIVSYNFFLFLRLELEEPFFNPNSPQNILEGYEMKILPVRIKQNGKTLEGYLTNWGENGFFCSYGSPEEKVRGRVSVETDIEGYTFHCIGEVISERTGGYGVRIISSPVPSLGWSDFYGIISEMGYRSAFKA